MNSRERFQAVLAGEIPDTVPIIPVVDGFFAPGLTGRPSDECWQDNDCLAGALALALERFGMDGVVAEMGLGPAPEVLGCPVQIEGNEVPLVTDRLIETRADLEKITVPDPWSGGKMEPVERLVALAGGDSVILGAVRSPFEYAATVRGLLEFMGDFYREPELVRDLIAACLPATLAVGRALAEAGVDAVVVKDSLASTSMISPDHYREFVYPAEREAVAGLEGIPVILHVCRNSLPILPLMAATGAAVLEIDSPVDLRQAREAAGDAVVLKGNIDAVSVIEKGTAADVDAAVSAAIDAARGGKFILSTGDSVPLSAPEENLVALVASGRRYGKYQDGDA
ncbi:MAG: uroporphyrinogen decarboxylase family protein [Thermoleophilia bacterium]